MSTTLADLVALAQAHPAWLFAVLVTVWVWIGARILRSK